jgi:hypothetical protein
VSERPPCHGRHGSCLPFLPAASPERRQEVLLPRIDIHDYLVQNPMPTFYFPIMDDSMEAAEKLSGFAKSCLAT